MAKSKLSGVTCTTPTFRANWVYVFKPRTFANQPDKKPQYSITCLFGKDQDLKVLQEAVHAASVEAWGTDKAKWPSKRHMPFKDQGTALRKNQNNEEYLPEEYVPGAVYFEAKTYNPPGAVGPTKGPDGKLEQLEDADLYSGCYARARVVFKAYDFQGNQGITCYLQHVQKVKDGTSLAGFTKAEDSFEAIEGAEEEVSSSDTDSLLAM